MIPAEVGEAGDGEPQAVDPPLAQRDARDLHRHGFDALLAHPPQQCVRVHGLRSRPGRGQCHVTDPHADGADDAGTPPGRSKAGFEQVAHGGLAVRSGDGQHRHGFRRMPVYVGREPAQDGARIGHHEHRDRGVTEQHGPLRVGEDRGRTECDGLCGVHRPVRVPAGQGGEEIAGLDLS